MSNETNILILAFAQLGLSIVALVGIHAVIVLKKRVTDLSYQVEHLKNAMSYETNLYDTQLAYETMYEERIEELREELERTENKTKNPAEILANGIYNIPERDLYEIRNNVPDREVGV